MKLAILIYDEKIFLLIKYSSLYQNQRIKESVTKLSFILFLLISKSKNLLENYLSSSCEI